LTSNAFIGSDHHQFVALRQCLHDHYPLPPRRALSNVVVPSAWIDDQLISERKAGLAAYLNHLLTIKKLQDNQVWLQFLTAPSFDPSQFLDTPSDLPFMVAKSTLAADQTTIESDDPKLAPVAATYYPIWAADDCPPERLDFTKFDIIFFGNAFGSLQYHT
jgi:chitinase